ncbi:MAG: alternative ribosome rescue aminoacyl-tRNA hydrolase ArfB [Planctomycetota bacterium]
MLEINSQIQIPDEELRFTYARSAGPGGQNVNKVNSKAILHWNVTATPHLPEPVKLRFLARYRARITVLGEVVISGQVYRDQTRNIDDCLERLREMIVTVLVPPTPRKKTRPSRGGVERRLQSKREQSDRKTSRRRPQSGHDD